MLWATNTKNKYIFVEFLFHSVWIPVVEIQSFLLCNAFFKSGLEFLPYGLNSHGKSLEIFYKGKRWGRREVAGRKDAIIKT